jgi:hypothetical protein
VDSISPTLEIKKKINFNINLSPPSSGNFSAEFHGKMFSIKSRYSLRRLRNSLPFMDVLTTEHYPEPVQSKPSRLTFLRSTIILLLKGVPNLKIGMEI